MTEASPPTGTRIKSRRGFASMSKAKRTEIAKRGGAAVPHDLRSFSQNRELAAEAGRKGGQRSKGGGRKPGQPRTPADEKATEWNGLKKNPLYER